MGLLTLRAQIGADDMAVPMSDRDAERLRLADASARAQIAARAAEQLVARLEEVIRNALPVIGRVSSKSLRRLAPSTSGFRKGDAMAFTPEERAAILAAANETLARVEPSAEDIEHAAVIDAAGISYARSRGLLPPDDLPLDAPPRCEPPPRPAWTPSTAVQERRLAEQWRGMNKPARKKKVWPEPRPAGWKDMSWDERYKHSVPVTWRNMGGMVKGIRAAFTEEHNRVQEFVDGETATLNRKIAALQEQVNELRALVGVRAELDELRQQVAVVRSNRAQVIDAVPTRKSGAA